MKIRFLASLIALTFIMISVFLQTSYSQGREIRILSPKDGDEIFLSSSETMPAKRPIKGDIRGFTRDEIEKFKLRVEVSIRTDKWYPQGIARVQNDGTWMLRQAYFGGATHIIKATLKDKSGNKITSATTTVTLIQ